MSRKYTLRTYNGAKLLERFEHRSASSLRDILYHPRHQPSDDPYDNTERATTFEIMDSLMTPLFKGNVSDAATFADRLR